MGLFSKKSTPSGEEYRGGCAEHDMRGPVRDTAAKANKDAWDHGKRMHGGKNPHGYVERQK